MSQPQISASARSVCPAPAALRGLVRYFHVERAGAGRVMIPATPHPMVTFFIAGGSIVHAPDGTIQVYDRPFLSGPITAAFVASWLPGTSFISAVCEPSRFGALFGVDIGDVRDRPLALAEIAPHVPTGALEQALRSGAGPQEWIDLLGAWLLALARRREARLRRAFALPGAMLFDPALDIARKIGLSVRQLERNHLAAYAMTLGESRRMARYVTALGLMIRNPGRRGLLTGIAGAAGYHDQAHMIRDFRQILGIAPGAVVASGADPDDDLMRLLRYEAAETSVIVDAGR